ncbi:neutral and basic amino acid transport protein rBAT-like isoform X2 [Myxocyprinus asiaticus]|uniref:neutral and basic amino acid transport protein rBAT-like isoform X2 n=1 Tax=Myxocyprinus asiaticus TaxID=70543 RepID=UPI00222208F5|nr:neutral and basic amino acid transport protein rBAT-like isoform X2 [Myxocyprinus asiaticus]
MSLTKIANIGLELQDGVQNTAFQEDVGDTSVASSSQEHDTASISVSGPEESAYTQIKPYAGMPKEVLMLHSSQACYRVPREILFWLIIACTLALIAMTIAIVALSPRCLGWWQVSPVYQVYLRSFKDSNADGIGDLKGIKEKLSHFEYLNIKAIWISPFYKSPMRDFGYDVEDFRQVDPLFGTMEDFDDLLASMHDKGLKLIMDYIPNHTSDKHIWFQLSRNGTELYKDYYIWVNCTKDKPPNNWGIIHFWLQKGVDGFRMNAVKHMLEATHLRNEPQVDPDQDPSTVDTEFELYHDYTYSQPGLHEILTNWRVEMDTFSREPGRHRLMVIESYDYEEVEKTMRYYGTRYATESDFPFNFYLLYLPDDLSGNKAKELVDFWMSNMPEGKWPNWVVGNHDKPRIGSSAGKEYIRAINMLLLTLPGTPTTYYGEEIGMTNVNVSVIKDPFGKFNPNNSRDPQRTPMQWSDKLYAGFSDSETGTWLDIAPDYTTVNVEVQQADPNSTISQYRTLSLLRGAELALSRGWFCYVWSDANVFAYLREMDGYKKAFLVVLNFGKDTETDLSSISELPDVFTVHLSTVPLSQKTFSKSSITTFKGQGLLLEYSSNRRFHPNHASECFVSEKACYMDVLDILYRC